MEFFLISIILSLLFFIFLNRKRIFVNGGKLTSQEKQKFKEHLLKAKEAGRTFIDDVIEDLTPIPVLPLPKPPILPSIPPLPPLPPLPMVKPKVIPQLAPKPQTKVDEQVLNVDMNNDNYVGSKYRSKLKIDNDVITKKYDLIDDSTLLAIQEQNQQDLTKAKQPKVKKDLKTFYPLFKLIFPFALISIIGLFTLINWLSLNGFMRFSALGIVSTIIYLTGIIYFVKDISKKIGNTLVYIGAVGYLLLGFYLLRINQGNTFALSVELMFFVYTIYISLFFGYTSAFIKAKGFSFLLLFSLYSSLISGCFILTSDSAIRVELILLINFAIFYFANKLFNKSIDIIKLALRAINQFAGIFAYLYVLGTLSQPNYFVCFLLLLIPVFFDIVSFARDHTKDIYSTIFFTPLKLLAITSLLSFNINQILVTSLMFVLLVTYCSAIPNLVNKHKELVKALDILRWTYTIFVIILLCFSSGLISGDINSLVRFGVIIVLFVLLIIPELVKKRYTNLSFVMIYVIVLIYQILFLLDPQIGLEGFSIGVIWLITITFIWSVIFKNKIGHFLLPLIVAGSFFCIYSSIITLSPPIIAVNHIIISLILLTYSYINKVPRLRYCAYILMFIAFYFLSLYLKRIGLFNFINDNALINEIIIIVPTLFFLITWDIRKQKNRNFKPELFGFILFGSMTYLYSLMNLTDMLYTTILALIYFIYCLFRFKNRIFLYIAFVVANLLIVILLRFISINEIILLMFISFISLVFAAFTTLFVTYKKVIFYEVTPTIKDLFIKLDNLCIALLGIYTLLLCVILIETSKVGININFLVTCFIIFLTFLLLNQRNIYVRYLLGLPLLIGVWDICLSYGLNFQFYVFPIFLDILFIYFLNYRLIASVPVIDAPKKYGVKPVKKINYLLLQTRFEYGTYIFFFMILLAQSLYEGDGLNLKIGLFLSVAAIIFLLIAIKRKNKFLIILNLLIIALEIVIRIYVIFASFLPLWSYLAVALLVVFDVGMYLLWKTEKKR